MTSTSYAAWLQYRKAVEEVRDRVEQWLGSIVVRSAASEPALATAVKELTDAVYRTAGLQPATVTEAPPYGCFTVVGTADTDLWAEYGVNADELSSISPEGYRLKAVPEGVVGRRALLVIGGSGAGVLYGVFHLIRWIQTGRVPDRLDVLENPANPLRMINQWDNADGSIERGYAGKSFFYENGGITKRLDRVRDYARLLASVGINAISINNVNVHAEETKFITRELLPSVAAAADVFRSYGIRLFLSINFAAPIQAGGLSTADPLDETVKRWWRDAVAGIYEHIPDFGGFLVKADSEHRPGPFTYGRDHADGANMLADALEPFGGLLIWRCFVYNCMQDWRDRTTDRAKAAYDHFTPLDGRFRDNIILQIKNGPMDFQVREPVSPLFGAMPQTNQLIEFQITQEYTGQQRHLCYLVPQWKEALDFDTYASGQGSTVKRIVDGTLFRAKHGGFAAVSNVGSDDNWTRHTLAQANLYGYGRLAWNPDLSAEDIAKEWIRMTFGGDDDQVTDVISDMLMNSWRIYENYTAPLGVGWMVTPNTHYGPDVDGYEYSRWGTYHFADRDGIGVDRTAATGTGYTLQYNSPNSETYESLTECPDELLLFFHHVPYSHRLKSGKTVIQHIYDTHFEGAEQAQRLVDMWRALEGKIDEERFSHVSARLEEQAAHAKHWRDVINTYFYRKSGVPDERGRTIY
ncbi:alpha-glucuronidase family glycosyl hydrolase [Paenibacillus thermotolerans]|uniref:alpha-glucuronidase family glycosyl hydrolase n=1 Tax=Paenibacillus thermotolerans TaxID=3027807 RepID=UPI002368EF32|nr:MULTISPECIES: alpha-glucuronidase family glycosyl hydrolase [unclassified Paenibacillus]